MFSLVHAVTRSVGAAEEEEEKHAEDVGIDYDLIHQPV